MPAAPPTVVSGAATARGTLSAKAPTQVLGTAAPAPPTVVPAGPPARTGRAAPAAPPAPRKHSSAGLLLGLAAVGLVAVVLALGAGWYLLRTRPAAPPADTVAEASEPPVSAPAAATLPSVPPATTVAESIASPEPAAPQASLPAAPAPTTPAAGTQRPARAADTRATALPAPPPQAPPADAAALEPAGGTSFLDVEPPQVDGAEAGRRLAESFRSPNSQGGSFGTQRGLRARDRSPRDLSRPEFPAVATLRHVMNEQEAFYRKEGRYGTLSELKSAGLLRLDVPFQPRQFARAGYRFELMVESDAFRITAIPTGGGPRPFIGDDSGFIRAGTE
jgi:general secretion pathway protein B